MKTLIDTIFYFQRVLYPFQSAYGWSTIPLNSCGISGVEATDGTTGALYYEYSLYWNDILSPAATPIFQLGQTQFKCRFDAQQHDAASQSDISEDTHIADPAEGLFSITVELQIHLQCDSIWQRTYHFKLGKLSLTAIQSTKTH